MHTNLAIATLALTSALGGCASVTSTMNPSETDGGLVYYMPKRDIVITVNNAGGVIASITASPSVSYADRSKAYRLEYHRHPLAKNDLAIDVSEAGLLTSSVSKQTGDAVAALAGLGTLAGYIRGGSDIGLQAAADGLAGAAAAGDCSAVGNHTFIVPAKTGDDSICEKTLAYKIERLGGDDDTKTGTNTSQRNDASSAGIFYRVNIPYKVTVSSPKVHSETIVFSPSESKVYFLPIARTFFANNEATITLSNGAGVPSRYSQNTEGEIAALLRLPATIAASYFAAIGELFSSFSTNKTSETTALNSTLALELTKMKVAACIDAIKERDTDRIASLGCAAK
jgi:hypothetical protein